MSRRKRSRRSAKKQGAQPQVRPGRQPPQVTVVRSRMPAEMVYSHHPLAPHVARYIASLYADKLLPGCELPSFGSNTPYLTLVQSTRFSLTAGTTIANSCFVVNPWMTWTDKVFWEKVSNGAEVAVYAPTAFTNAAAYTTGAICPGLGQQTDIVFDNRFNTSSTNGYMAHVRPRGVRIRISYFGTKLNEGGLIYAIHNPQNMSLIHQIETNQPAGVASFDTSVASEAQLSAWNESVSTHHIGDEFEFVWRPRNLNFVDLQNLYPSEAVVVAATNVGNPIIAHELLPTKEEQARVMNAGWLAGFVLKPATATAATAIPYSVDVITELDVQIRQIESTTATAIGQNLSTGQKRPVSDPVLEAHLHNALADIHTRRSAREPSAKAKNLSLKGAENAGLRLGKKAALGAAEEAGSYLASRLAAAF